MAAAGIALGKVAPGPAPARAARPLRAVAACLAAIALAVACLAPDTLADAAAEYEFEGRFDAPPPGTPARPYGIAVDPSTGAIAVAVQANNASVPGDSAVLLLHPNGTLASRIDAPDAPRGVDIGPNGRIAVADSSANRTLVFDQNGTQVMSLAAADGLDMERPYGVAIDRPDGRIIVADTRNHRVLVFHPNGTLAFSITGAGSQSGNITSPYAVAAGGPDGRIVAIDTSDRVHVYGRDGTPEGTFGPLGGTNFGIPDVDPTTGRIVVPDPALPGIRVFEQNGTPVATYAARGSQAGQFTWPFGAAVDGSSGRILVADFQQKSVSVLRGPGASSAIPHVDNVTSASPDGSYGAGSSIGIRVSFSLPVSVMVPSPSALVAPYLELDTGGRAVYSSGSGTDALLFVYEVEPGHSSDRLSYARTGALVLPNADTAIIGRDHGLAANLTLPDSGGPKSLSRFSDISVDWGIPQPGSGGSAEYAFESRIAVPPAGSEARPYGIAVNASSGAIAIAVQTDEGAAVEESAVLLMDPSGTLASRIDMPVSPRGVDIGPDGRIAVADSAANRTLVFNQNGMLVLTIGAADGMNMSRPYGLAIDRPDGRIIVLLAVLPFPHRFQVPVTLVPIVQPFCPASLVS